MPRIGRLNHKTFFQMTQQALLPHDAQDSLVIDHLSLSPRLMGHSSIAIAGKLQDDALDLISQGNLLFIFSRCSHLLIVPTAADSKQLTESLN